MGLPREKCPINWYEWNYPWKVAYFDPRSHITDKPLDTGVVIVDPSFRIPSRFQFGPEHIQLPVDMVEDTEQMADIPVDLSPVGECHPCYQISLESPLPDIVDILNDPVIYSISRWISNTRWRTL